VDRRVSPAQVGAVFGRLTVVKVLPRVPTPEGRTRPFVRVRCACGIEYNLQASGLVSGSSTRCRKCALEEAIRHVHKGDRFDRLVVQDYVYVTSKSGHARPMVLCLCDCGNQVKVRQTVLQGNMTNNCGCAPRGAWTGAGSLSTTRYNRYKRAAHMRGLVFDVTIEDLWALFEKQGRACALTGLPLEFNMKTAGRNTASLDRVDSSEGYVTGNVQWVHRDVNLMKNALSEERLLELCRAVVRTHDSPCSNGS
jgi:hypothetical protein